MDDEKIIRSVDIAKAHRDASRDMLSEALLRTGTGDRAAFEYLYRNTSAKLFGVCLRIFPNRTEAEEALQDAYINIWNRASRFQQGRASPISWLVTVTRNRAIDRLRAKGKVKYAPIEAAANIADIAPLADTQLQAKDDSAALHSCIETLDARDARFITSAFVGGVSYAELAAHENMPLGTVKSRIRRALIKLRICLGERT